MFAYKNNKEDRVGRIVCPWERWWLVVVEVGEACAYAAGFSSVTVVAPEATEPVSSGDAWHARDGNFLYSSARYFGWLIPYTIGLYTALALANSEPQIVARGLMGILSKTPV